MTFGEDGRLSEFHERQPARFLQGHSPRLLLFNEQRQMLSQLVVEVAIAARPRHDGVNAGKDRSAPRRQVRRRHVSPVVMLHEHIPG